MERHITLSLKQQIAAAQQYVERFNGIEKSLLLAARPSNWWALSGKFERVNAGCIFYFSSLSSS